jgi:A/G-specific adenine glycosylase
VTEFHDRVLNWFGRFGRKDLPWQSEPSPYRVWVSEIMLQQTQVATVIPYFQRFMQSFAGIRELADTHQDEVLRHWAGLGYYARARNLHKAAQIVRDEFGGRLPADFEQLLALPGIGRSTAGAILALSGDQRFPILDGNVKRVLARFHAVEGWPGNGAVAAELWAYADSHTPTDRVAEYTQAMMDLGATVCTRSQPLCAACPLGDHCESKRHGSQALYPGKKNRRPRPLRQTCMLLAQVGDAIFLQKRPPAGIWGGLWSLPEVEKPDAINDWCIQQLVDNLQCVLILTLKIAS